VLGGGGAARDRLGFGATVGEYASVWRRPSGLELRHAARAAGAQGGHIAPEPHSYRRTPSVTASTLDTTAAKLGATAITFCEQGKVSSWSGGVRNPTDATTCAACTNNLIAARTGAPRWHVGLIGSPCGCGMI